jgi:hypothetical protein
MEIWTSRFQNKALAARPELVKVGITVGQPRWPLGYEYERLPLLAPYGLLHEADRERFTRAYCTRLDAAGVAAVLAALQAISDEHDGRDLVLLCYEDLAKVYPDGSLEWCHRVVFSEWWRARTGEVILELPRADAPAAPTDATGVAASSLWTWSEDAVATPTPAGSE